jgi:hypothetical protein
LQALIGGLEHKRFTHKQFYIAKIIAKIVAWLDSAKNAMSPILFTETTVHVEILHIYATRMAGSWVTEIYSAAGGAQK